MRLLEKMRSLREVVRSKPRERYEQILRRAAAGEEREGDPKELITIMKDLNLTDDDVAEDLRSVQILVQAEGSELARLDLAKLDAELRVARSDLQRARENADRVMVEAGDAVEAADRKLEALSTQRGQASATQESIATIKLGAPRVFGDADAIELDVPEST